MHKCVIVNAVSSDCVSDEFKCVCVCVCVGGGGGGGHTRCAVLDARQGGGAHKMRRLRRQTQSLLERYILLHQTIIYQP